MYGIFPQINHKNQANVGNYILHEWYGDVLSPIQMWHRLIHQLKHQRYQSCIPPPIFTRPVSKIQKMMFVNSKQKVRSLYLPTPTPLHFESKTPKIIQNHYTIYICIVWYPEKWKMYMMTISKQNNNLQQQKSRKFGNQVTILRSIFDFHRHQKSTRVHHTAHCRVHTRTPRRLKVVRFLCAFLNGCMLIYYYWLYL